MIPQFLSENQAVFSALPTGGNGWSYYAICAVFFLLCGLFFGYLIWRKGHLQMQDAEAEVERTAGELQDLREDLRSEESLLRTGEEGEEIEKAVSAARR